MDAEQSQKQRVPSPKEMELHSLSAGTIADLCIVTKETKEELYQRSRPVGEEDEPFVMVPYGEPLRPYDLAVSLKTPHIEPGRVDIRIMALYEELRMMGAG